MGRTSYGEIELRASRKRTLTAAILIFTLMPATIAVSTLCFGGARYMITSLLIIIYTMVPFFMIFEKRKPKAREVVLIAMMLVNSSPRFASIKSKLNYRALFRLIAGKVKKEGANA